MGMGASGCILGRAASLLASSSGPCGENEFTPQFMAIFIGKIWENDDSAVDFWGSLFSDEPIVSHSYPPIEVLLLRWPWKVLEFGPRLLLGSCLKQTRQQLGCRWVWQHEQPEPAADRGGLKALLTLTIWGDFDRFGSSFLTFLDGSLIDWGSWKISAFCFFESWEFSIFFGFPHWSHRGTDANGPDAGLGGVQQRGWRAGALLDPGAAFDKRGYVISKLPPTKFKNI